VPQNISVGWLQLNSSDQPEENIQLVLKGLKSFEKDKVSVVVTPENVLYQRLTPGPATFALTGADDPVLAPLKDWAVQHQTALVLGGVRTQAHDHLCTNSIWWIDLDGKAHLVYSKAHLFDVDVEGEARVRESDIFAPGDSPSLVEFQGVKWGTSICYDLRFPELYLTLAQEGAQIILVPSSFLVKTGRSHWLTLLRARAIENQCYVLAPAQGGVRTTSTGDARQAWGESVLIDPWGVVVSQMPSFDEFSKGVPEREALAGRAVLDLTRIQQVRRQMPVQSHKKPTSFYSQVKTHSL
jgi:predicted amidohydrolase